MTQMFFTKWMVEKYFVYTREQYSTIKGTNYSFDIHEVLLTWNYLDKCKIMLSEKDNQKVHTMWFWLYNILKMVNL